MVWKYKRVAADLLILIATSNDPWGPTGTEMGEISQMTFNSYARFGNLRRGYTDTLPLDRTNFMKLWIC